MAAAELGTETVTIETARGRLTFDTRRRLGFKRATGFHEFEPDTLAWLDEHRDAPCFWDIGANRGLFSLYAARGSDQRVVAFEPAGRTFGLLCRNIELNGLSERIAAYCVALAGETRLDTLNLSTTEPGHAGHGFGTDTNQFGRDIEVAFRQPAIGFAIDDFVRTFAPPLPSHVKIDVDGIEAAILRGGRETLASSSVRSMLVEIEGDIGSANNREIFEIMAALGFAPEQKDSPSYRNVVFHRR